jgi:hypothetical protein
MARKGGTPENLIPAKKGEVRNPTGRPKKLPNLDALLAEILGEEKDGVTAADAILRRLRQMAANGNLRAAEILLDRAYGKAITRTEMSGPNGAPLTTNTTLLINLTDGTTADGSGKP